MFEFTVLGKTATKGSTRSFVSRKTGKVVTLADNKHLASWTRMAEYEARRAGAEYAPKPQAVQVHVCFQFLRPTSGKGRTRVDHTVKPDIDKLLRAVLDALTGVAYEDDSQVVSVIATKSYGTHEECFVRVTAL